MDNAPVTEPEARKFVERYETAVRRQDWDAVQRLFLPGARVVFQEPERPDPIRLAPRRWIEEQQAISSGFAYSRKRHIEEIDVRTDGAMVKSTLVESLFVPGVRIRVTSEESMHIYRDDDALRISVLGIWQTASQREGLDELPTAP